MHGLLVCLFYGRRAPASGREVRRRRGCPRQSKGRRSLRGRPDRSAEQHSTGAMARSARPRGHPARGVEHRNAGLARHPDNILRLEVADAVWRIRHMVESSAGFVRRGHLLVDNLALVLALTKGRARSRHLWRPLQQVCAWALGSGYRFVVRWIQSEVNPAGGPSLIPASHLDHPATPSNVGRGREAVRSPAPRARCRILSRRHAPAA